MAAAPEWINQTITALSCMRILLLAALIVLMGIGGADARRRHHHRGTDSVQFASPTVEPAFESRQNTARSRRQPPTVASLVPGNWVLEQQNPNWNGKRFLSPDRTSWLAIYRASAEEEPIADHMRSIIFAKDETHHVSEGRADVGRRVGLQGKPHFLSEGHSRLCG